MGPSGCIITMKEENSITSYRGIIISRCSRGGSREDGKQSNPIRFFCPPPAYDDTHVQRGVSGAAYWVLRSNVAASPLALLPLAVLRPTMSNVVTRSQSGPLRTHNAIVIQRFWQLSYTVIVTSAPGLIPMVLPGGYIKCLTMHGL